VTNQATYSELVDFLTEQHEQIAALVSEVSAASDSIREEAFRRLCRLLAAHEALEQQTVHVAARGQDLGDIAEDRLSEEAELAAAISALEALDVDSADFVDRFSDMETILVSHADKEETIEFSQLSPELSGELQLRASRGMQLADEAVTAHGTALPYGPYAEMLDTALDLVAHNV